MFKKFTHKTNIEKEKFKCKLNFCGHETTLNGHFSFGNGDQFIVKGGINEKIE